MDTYIIKTTCTEFYNTDTDRPAFVMGFDGTYADAVGVQDTDGTWTIGRTACTFDAQGVRGIGSVRMPDGKSVWFGSWHPIDHNVKCDSVDAAIAHAEHMWDTVDAD